MWRRNRFLPRTYFIQVAAGRARVASLVEMPALSAFVISAHANQKIHDGRARPWRPPAHLASAHSSIRQAALTRPLQVRSRVPATSSPSPASAWPIASISVHFGRFPSISTSAMAITARVRDELLGSDASLAPPANPEAAARTTPANARWSEWEHERFLEALALFPEGPWNRVAAHVGSKNRRQVMSHAQKYRQRLARRRSRQRTLRELQAGQARALDAAPAPAAPTAATTFDRLARTVSESQLIEAIEAEILSELLPNWTGAGPELGCAEGEASQFEPSVTPLTQLDAISLGELLSLPDVAFVDLSAGESVFEPLEAYL